MHCTQCRSAIEEDARFCPECGASVFAAAAAAAAAPGSQTPAAAAPASAAPQPGLERAVRYCGSCGSPVVEGKKFRRLYGAQLAYRPPASHEIADRVRARSGEALEAFKIFSVNPVGGLPVVFETLGPKRAMEVGIVFAVACAVSVTIGSYLVLPGFARSGAGQFIKLAFLAAVFVLCSVAAIAAGRKTFRGAGSFEGDVFIAGASNLPLSFTVLISGIVGLANVEVIVILTVFAVSYSILMLFTGCTKISKIPEGAAAVAVPAILLIGGWLFKIMFTAMM